MDTSLRDILAAVRDGRLDPAEAATLLASPDAPQSTVSPVLPTDLPTTDLPTTDPPTTDLPTTEIPATDVATADLPAAVSIDDVSADQSAADPSADAWADVVDDPSGPPPAESSTGVPPYEGARDLSQTAADAPATTALRVRAMTRRVRILADSTVTTVSVDGPHELRREGGTLILESDRDLPFGDPFAFLPAMRGGFRLQPRQGLPISLGSDLVVRINPSIALDVDVTAGSLSVRGVRDVRARVTAGSARIDDMNGQLDLHVVGGTAKVDMTARGGANRIRCESGSISLRLRKDSDVRLRPDAQLGRIVIDGAEGGREIVVGAGTGRLDVEIVMGNLQVEVEA